MGGNLEFFRGDPELAAMLDRRADAAETEERLTSFTCPDCDGHGCYLKNGDTEPLDAVVCERCHGAKVLWATEDQIIEAGSIGSDNPFCRHEWSFTGTAYGGDDESYYGEGRCYCSLCGADGDA